MNIITVSGKQVEVDIEGELRRYPWHKERWTSEKLIACSPFRDDNTPSFFVNISGEYAGTWGDSGAYEDEYRSGNFVKLLGFLRGSGEEEALEYLLDTYGILYEIKEDEPIRITTPRLRQSSPKREIALFHTVTRGVSPYLITRGIASDVQQRYDIGYNSLNIGFTAIPWHFTDTGEIANVKYRATRGKRFFFEPDAKPIRELVYGLHQARGEPCVIICEGEIDALSWETAGYAAIATGSAYISEVQAELIIREGFDEIYLAGDNDKQGQKFNQRMSDMFRGYAKMYEVDYGKEKDANDVLLRRGVRGLSEILDRA